MNTTLINHIAQSSLKENLPEFKVGQTIKVHQRIKEGDKTRLQVFEGLIIKVHRKNGIHGMITVRKIVDGVGVERVFPVHSPIIAKVQITKEGRTRRNKLYYLRERTGKAARMKTTMLENAIYEPAPLGHTKKKAAEAAEAAIAAELAAKEKAAAEAEAAKAAQAAAEAPVAETPAPEAPAVEESK